MTERTQSEYLKRMEARKKLLTHLEVTPNKCPLPNESLPLICLKSNKRLKQLSSKERKLLNPENSVPQTGQEAKEAQAKCNALKRPKMKPPVPCCR